MTATTKSAVVLLPLIGLIGIAAAQRDGRRPGPPMMRARNMKVLKGISPQQLMATMQVYSASLGVRCDFCHVARAFERDDKPEKRTARAMIRLVQSLNAHERVIDHKATCFMCHHGRPTPETVAPGGPGGPAGPGGLRRPRTSEGERGDRD